MSISEIQQPVEILQRIQPINEPQFIHTGLDVALVREKEQWLREEALPSLHRQGEDMFPKATLSPEVLEKIKKAEMLCKTFFKKKLKKYGYNTDFIDEEEVIFISTFGEEDDENTGGGGHDSLAGNNFVIVHPSMYMMSRTIAHEFGHAITKHIIHLQWNEKGLPSRAIARAGLGEIDSMGQPIGYGLENIFNVLDEVELAKNLLELFPDEKQKINNGLNSPEVKERRDQINNSQFGLVSDKDLFYLLDIRADSTVEIPSVATTAYLLAREISKILGYSLCKSDPSMITYSEEEIIEAGRCWLDKTRYTHELSGRKILQSVFGTESTDLLYSLSDGETLDEYDVAMKIVRAKEVEMGILPNPFIDKPLGWK